MSKIETILLATDVSRASEAAEEQAIELAVRLGSRLVIVSAVYGSPELRSARLVAVERVVQRARAAGATATGLTWAGEAGESVVEAAAAEHADLIVVGTHERGTVGRLFLGSVSHHVVRHARCPVMVVRPTHVLSGSSG
jgi:nucleotide-binding universal stress UspA family protein